MLWLITEDSKPGYTFWKSVMRNYNWLTADSKNIRTSESARGMVSAAEKLMIELSSDPVKSGHSVIFCALDNTEDAYVIRESIIKYSDLYGIPVGFTFAFSFEAMLASYKDWDSTCPTIIRNPVTEQEKVIVGTFKYIQKCTRKFIPVVFSADMTVYAEYCRLIKGKSPRSVFSTAEQTVTEVLNLYTGRGIFSVGKKDITLCWLYSCGGAGNSLFCPYANAGNVSGGRRNYFWQLCSNDWANGDSQSILQFRNYQYKITYFANNSLLRTELNTIFNMLEKYSAKY